MEVEIKMPDLAATEAEVKVVKWLVQVGQEIRRGQPLLEVETDKAATEVECFATGVLKELRAEPEEQVAAGDVIAVIEVEASGGERKAPEGKAGRQADRPAGPVEHREPSPRKAGGMFARNRRESGGDE